MTILFSVELSGPDICVKYNRKNDSQTGHRSCSDDLRHSDVPTYEADSGGRYSVRNGWRALWVVGILLSGCASTNALVGASNIQPERTGDCPLVVMNKFPSDAEYQRLGTVEAMVAGSKLEESDLESLLPEMKEAACHLGANALVVAARVNAQYWRLWASEQGRAEGVAIKVLASAN